MVAGAPLIFCPSDGKHVSKRINQVCKRFQAEHKIDVRVFEMRGSRLAVWQSLTNSITKHVAGRIISHVEGEEIAVRVVLRIA